MGDVRKAFIFTTISNHFGVPADENELKNSDQLNRFETTTSACPFVRLFVQFFRLLKVKSLVLKIIQIFTLSVLMSEIRMYRCVCLSTFFYECLRIYSYLSYVTAFVKYINKHYSLMFLHS
jgi:hypothetical protein